MLGEVIKEEIKEEAKKEEDLTADEIFDKAFGDAIEEEPEADPTDKKEEETLKTEIEDKSLKGEEAKPPEEVINQDETKAEVKSEEIVQREKEDIKQEPPAKAQEETAKKTPPEPKKEEKPVDFSLLFKGWENDIEDPELKKELLEFAEEADSNAKYVNTATTIIGKRLVNYVNESFKILIERMIPYFEATAKQIEKGHISAIRGAHEDFDNLKDNKDVTVWIKEQPSYLQKSLMDVYTKGEAEDVIDLLSRYKKDRGLGIKTDEAIVQGKERKDEIKNKVQETIDNLSAVKTKDRPIHIKQKSNNTEDFDAAFEEAASRR